MDITRQDLILTSRFNDEQKNLETRNDKSRIYGIESYVNMHALVASYMKRNDIKRFYQDASGLSFISLLEFRISLSFTSSLRHLFVCLPCVCEFVLVPHWFLDDINSC